MFYALLAAGAKCIEINMRRCSCVLVCALGAPRMAVLPVIGPPLYIFRPIERDRRFCIRLSVEVDGKDHLDRPIRQSLFSSRMNRQVAELELSAPARLQVESCLSIIAYRF